MATKTESIQTLNVDQTEIEKFAALAHRWWDKNSEFKPLHQINPLRLQFIDDAVSLAGKKVLDVGCGGGILTESMAKAGASVTGIDLGEKALKVAQLHQHESGVQVDYQYISVEEMAEKAPASFDVVTCMEMLEHVPDPAHVVKACAKLVKPGGSLFFSTINRNPKSYLFAVIGAEYLLRMLPKGTHEYAKFIKPSELSQWLRDEGITLNQMRGMQYHPFNDSFSLELDVSVNYLVHAVK
jgi:2-polyprenyl-6-hydroxyphenyl methylase / 3-demethylubiquinone-9 3-methyltransferase